MFPRTSFVTPSGSTVQLTFRAHNRHRDRDADQYHFTAVSSSGREDQLTVTVVCPDRLPGTLEQAKIPAGERSIERVVYMAALSRFEAIPALPATNFGTRDLEVDHSEAPGILRQPKRSDREIRLFLMRRIYDSYSQKTLSDPVLLDDLDFGLLGCSATDFLRNAQVLEAEGYLHIHASTMTQLPLIPTAKLVREVERYGGSREDVANEHDYLGALTAYPDLSPHAPVLRQEFHRFGVALSETELVSVFRAIAPTVEAILKDLLKRVGCQRALTDLGSAIAELQTRNLAPPGVVSQLSYVLKFTRDMSGHGNPLPVSVLRVACATTFELAPALGALFPRQ